MTAFVLALSFLMLVPQDPGPPKDSAKTSDYVLGAGDVISISVFGLKEFEQTIRVSNSGKIHVPYLGVLKVHGLIPRQVEVRIAMELIERQLLKEPWVQVRVEEHRSHPVFILGEVQFAGQFVMYGEWRVLDLIAASGGFNDVHSPIGYLYRRKAFSSDDPELGAEDEVIKIVFSELYDESHPENNMLLRGGDILYVPERKRDHYFVVGDVGRPGAFEISPDIPVLATQAIAKAGGPLMTAKMGKGTLMRYTDAGDQEEKSVDFQAILKGKKPDVAILPNDIIFIPGSSAKTLGYGLLNIIPTALTQGLIF
jgi:polysaccharide export outer membrane protein